MQFCDSCEEVLTIDSTNENNKLILTCNKCGSKVESKHLIIYEKDANSEDNYLTILKYAREDITLPRERAFCSTCNKNVITSYIRKDKTMKKMHVCHICNSYWGS
jgi:DNA-directed RNA polymerase subunit M/transcription elongation factor TFIIS